MPHLITWTRASKKIRVGIGQPAPAMSLLHQTTHLAGANAVRFRRSCRVKAELAHGTSTTTLQDPPRQPQPPSFPLPAKIFYSLINLVLCFAKRRDGTLNRRCISFLDAVRSPPDPDGGPDGVATSDHVVDPELNLSVRYYSPPPAEEIRDGQVALPVVVYFHGGGFVTGSTAAPQFDGFCRRLSKQLPARVVSVDYRLAPGHRYPAPCDDGVAVLRWLDGGSGLFIDDLSAVFLAGDSAGGNIAHHVARRAAAEERYERDEGARAGGDPALLRRGGGHGVGEEAAVRIEAEPEVAVADLPARRLRLGPRGRERVRTGLVHQQQLEQGGVDALPGDDGGRRGAGLAPGQAEVVLRGAQEDGRGGVPGRVSQRHTLLPRAAGKCRRAAAGAGRCGLREEEVRGGSLDTTELGRLEVDSGSMEVKWLL
ncbi:putative carboxylesterase 18 [Iris pallida]|uniref:Carboxylesterase 18 n=1 Tax=Iris pallida TaxID=29817 RepID=A0AAX6GS19_IRIPA|nr:putative carboxylesterase 18 [Iris pallida]